MLIALAIVLAATTPAQARPELTPATDSTAVLTAIRAIDLRQLCRCPVVLLDTTVRRLQAARIFEVTSGPAMFTLNAADRAALRLSAGRKVVGTSLRVITGRRRDTAVVAVGRLSSEGSTRRVLVVVTPPSGPTAGFLVSVALTKRGWRTLGVQSVYDP